MTTRQRVDSAYEVTVLGRLGPAMQCALRCDASSHGGTELIVHAVVPEQTDLVDIVNSLLKLDLQVTGVAEIVA